MNPVAKNVFRVASFATVIIPPLCLHLFLLPGGSGSRHLTQIWAGAALAGAIFAYLGGGGPSKQPTEKLEILAMALNLTCLAVLGIVLMASSVHD